MKRARMPRISVRGSRSTGWSIDAHDGDAIGICTLDSGYPTKRAAQVAARKLRRSILELRADPKEYAYVWILEYPDGSVVYNNNGIHQEWYMARRFELKCDAEAHRDFDNPGSHLVCLRVARRRSRATVAKGTSS